MLSHGTTIATGKNVQAIPEAGIDLLFGEFGSDLAPAHDATFSLARTDIVFPYDWSIYFHHMVLFVLHPICETICETELPSTGGSWSIRRR